MTAGKDEYVIEGKTPLEELEEKFGITLEDMFKQVIEPNMQLIQELKTKNVANVFKKIMFNFN